MSEDCIFCKIIRKQIPASVVYENHSILAFLDVNPANKGHTLIIPKRHAQTTLDLKEDESKELIAIVLKIARAVKKVVKCSGFNIIQNDGKTAGQLVMHAHFHVIPRFENDGLEFRTLRRKYEEGEINKIAEQIHDAIK